MHHFEVKIRRAQAPCAEAAALPHLVQHQAGAMPRCALVSAPFPFRIPDAPFYGLRDFTCRRRCLWNAGFPALSPSALLAPAIRLLSTCVMSHDGHRITSCDTLRDTSHMLPTAAWPCHQTYHCKWHRMGLDTALLLLAAWPWLLGNELFTSPNALWNLPQNFECDP